MKNKEENKKFGSKKDVAIVNSVTALRFIASFLVMPIFKILGGLSAALFSAIFMLTDCIDGFLARKLKSSTFFGALFDGITDKLYGIISFLILMSINPIAYSIPILLEIAILIIQKKKFNNNKNIKSNQIGKIKTWLLGISIVCSFGIVELMDIKSIFEYIKYSSLNMSQIIQNTLTLLGIELPMIISQIVTLKSYIKEAKTEELENNKIEEINMEIATNDIEETKKQLENINNEKIILQNELSNLEKIKSLTNAMFSPEFYNENKDMPIKKLTKDIFKK